MAADLVFVHGAGEDGRIPGAELVILPAAGHYPQVEQELQFNQTLEAFLARLQ